MAQGCYNFCMTSEIDSLQERVDAIRATGDADLAGRAWHALSKVLFEFTRRKTGRSGRNTPMIRRVAADDVSRLISDLLDRQQAH
jgi:hypothetical protein